MARRRLEPLVLSEEERLELEALGARRKTAQALAVRARIVLACAEGGLNKEVAAEIGVTEQTVKVHRGNAVRKMGAKSLAELVRMADLLGVHRSDS